jgi:hypothetical protein
MAVVVVPSRCGSMKSCVAKSFWGAVFERLHTHARRSHRDPRWVEREVDGVTSVFLVACRHE